MHKIEVILNTVTNDLFVAVFFLLRCHYALCEIAYKKLNKWIKHGN